MIRFAYKGKRKDGTTKTGTIEAASKRAAIARLRNQEGVLLILSLSKENQFDRIKMYMKQKMENLGKSSFQKNKQSQDGKTEIKIVVTDDHNLKQDIQENKNIFTMDIKQLLSREAQRNVQTIQTQNERMANSSDLKEGNSIDFQQTNSLKKIKQRRPLFESFKKITHRDLAEFTNQLSLLLESGVSTLNSLHTIEVHAENVKMKRTVRLIARKMENGNSLSEALSFFPKLFSPLYISMVQVGEATGRVHSVLADLSNFLKMQEKIKREIVKASIYPMIILTVLLIMMTLGSIFVIPKFKELFMNFGMELPQLTKTVFWIADYAKIWMPIVCIILFGSFFIYKGVPSVKKIVKKINDRVSLRVPIVKKVVSIINMFQLSLSLRILLKNGIKLTDALQMVSMTVSNGIVRREIINIKLLVETGMSIGESFAQQRHISALLKSSMGSGEEAGKIPEMLEKLNEYYDQELKFQLERLGELIQPLSVVFIALIAVPFIFAIFIPIIKISSGDWIQE